MCSEYDVLAEYIHNLKSSIYSEPDKTDQQRAAINQFLGWPK